MNRWIIQITGILSLAVLGYVFYITPALMLIFMVCFPLVFLISYQKNPPPESNFTLGLPAFKRFLDSNQFSLSGKITRKQSSFLKIQFHQKGSSFSIVERKSSRNVEHHYLKAKLNIRDNLAIKIEKIHAEKHSSNVMASNSSILLGKNFLITITDRKRRSDRSYSMQYILKEGLNHDLLDLLEQLCLVNTSTINHGFSIQRSEAKIQVYSYSEVQEIVLLLVDLVDVLRQYPQKHLLLSMKQSHQAQIENSYSSLYDVKSFRMIMNALKREDYHILQVIEKENNYFKRFASKEQILPSSIKSLKIEKNACIYEIHKEDNQYRVRANYKINKDVYLEIPQYHFQSLRVISREFDYIPDNHSSILGYLLEKASGSDILNAFMDKIVGIIARNSRSNEFKRIERMQIEFHARDERQVGRILESINNYVCAVHYLQFGSTEEVILHDEQESIYAICVICFQKLEQGDVIDIISCCNSTVHSDHLVLWLRRKNTCPYCAREQPSVRKYAQKLS